MAGRIAIKPAHQKRLRLRGSQQSRTNAAAATKAARRTKTALTRPIIGKADAVTLDDPSLLLRVRLPIRLTNGNTGRNHSFYASARFRRDLGTRLIAWGLKRTPFEHPVTVTVIRVLAKREREWDTDCWQRGNLKEIIDALTAAKRDKLPSACWFHDDSKKWITATHFATDSTERPLEPAIILEIRNSP